MATPAHEVLRAGPMAIFRLDPAGRCTFAAGPGCAELSLQPGRPLDRDLFSDSRGAQVLDRVLAGDRCSIEGKVDGRLVQTDLEPIQGEDGLLEGVAGVSMDVTAGRRARHEHARFKAMAESSQNVIAIAATDGITDYVNPRGIALGLPPAGADLWETAGELLGGNITAEIRASVASTGRWSGEVVVRSNGVDRAVEAQVFPIIDLDGGELLGTAFIALDISELRRSEQALRATNADLMKFRSLVETSGEFIAIAGLDGVVQYVNPAGRDLVGMTPDSDVTSTTISDYLTPEGLERSLQVEQPAVIEHGRWKGESSLRGPDGRPIPVEIASFLMRDLETGAPFALATVQRDITERLAVARAKEEFVTLVAHELRTPLASVKGYLEIANDSTELGDYVSLPAHLRVAARNVERMERLVEQILGVAGERRSDHAQRRPRDLVHLVEQAVESARPQAEAAGLDVRLVTGPPMTVLLDGSLTEVVDNLLSNATKHTPSGGKIVVDLSREDDSAVLSVTDTGPGVPVGERNLIFEKFSRGNRSVNQAVPGLGLGLFLARSIVEAHDGQIVVEEAPSGGARFVVRLPLSGDDASP